MKSVTFIQNENPAAKKGYAVGEEINLVGDFRDCTETMFFQLAKQVLDWTETEHFKNL